MFDWFDWNGNGAIDDEDRMLNLMVFTEIMESEQNRGGFDNADSQTGGGGWVLLGIIFLILALIFG